jgi:hypothetical protein
VQTFLPYSSYHKSFECLDYRRLGKQRVEAFQLLVANEDSWALEVRTKRTGKTDTPKGWRNHPAAVMWRNYQAALRQYYNACIREWIRRGYNNTMESAPLPDAIEIPHWLGNEAFHSSHRSNLIRKDPEYYSQFGWTEGPDQEYIWPKEDSEVGLIISVDQ